MRYVVNIESFLLQYNTRVLFYVSQLILSKNNSANPGIYNEALISFASILEEIETNGTVAEINKLMSTDIFLNKKLLTVKKSAPKEPIDIDAAKTGIKNLFQKKGIQDNPTVNNLINVIADNFAKYDSSDGNFFQMAFSMAGTIAEEARPELERNPDALQELLTPMVEIFQDMMNSPEGEGCNIPDEFKNIISAVASMTGAGAEMTPESIPQIMNTLGIDAHEDADISNIMTVIDRLAADKGMNQEEFCRSLIPK